MKVIRKELTSTQITPANTRYDATTNSVQNSTDGGTTWQDASGLDPRTSTTYQFPPRTGGTAQCDAAANMLAKLKSIVHIFEQGYDAIQSANATLAVILLFMPEIGIVVFALQALCELLLAIGTSLIETAFTDAQWDKVLCILNCDINADGTVSSAELDRIISDIHTQCDPVVYDVLYTIFHYALGNVGLTNAGATGAETGDCSACLCEWGYRWNSNAQMSADSWFHSYDTSVSQYWSKGFGLTLELIHIEFGWTWTGVSLGSGGSGSQLWQTNDFTGTLLVDQEPLGSVPSPLLWDGDISKPGISFGIVSGAGADGTTHIDYLELHGKGSIPSDWTHGTRLY